MEAKVSEILHQIEALDFPEKQNLFWSILHKMGNEQVFSYQSIDISEKLSYVISFPNWNPTKRNWHKENSVAEKPHKSAIKFDLLKGKITVPDDFNEPLDDFKEYMY